MLSNRKSNIPKAELLPLPREFGFRAIPEECVNTEVLDNVAHRPDYTRVDVF